MADVMKCSKCGALSGDDWKQCVGSCPMPGSPHYVASVRTTGAMKLVPVKPDAGLMSVIAAMVRRIAVPVSLVPEEVYFDNVHARQIYKAITDAAAAYPLASTQRPEREAIMQIIDANKYEPWTVDRAGQMADAILASPPAREEAPAEGAGEPSGAAKLVAYEDAHNVALELGYPSLTEALEHLALRSHTSEPEAGAVAWRVRQRVMTFSGQPGPWWGYGESPVVSADDPVYEQQALYTHPAPATADKLPDDVRRLVLAARAVAFGPDCGRNAVIDALDKASEAFADRVPWDDEPPAALNEGGE